MKRLLQTMLGCMSMLSVSAQSTFTSGNLVVLQTSGTASKSSSAVTLKEFTTSGVVGITVPIPSTGPTPFQSAGIFGGSEGFLTTSTDGKYLVLAGYATAATIVDITATASSATPRTVGLVYPSGFYLQYDTSKAFYSANDIRGGISDGTNFWTSGASNATDGIDYFGPGTHAGLAAAATPPKAYGLRIFNGNIYYSTQKAGPNNLVSNLGIFQLGTGLPTSGVVSVTQVIGTGATAIPEDFSFNPAGNICYIAINLNNATGGIQKWTNPGSGWVLSYTLPGITNAGAYSLVVDYSGAQPVIYATTFETGAGGNRIIKIVDNGTVLSAVTTTLVAATANTYYKGITFAPVASGTPLVNISVSKDTASEAAVSTVTVTANVSTTVTATQTVTVGVSGTGITAGDYTLSNTTITIPAGASSGSVTFTVKDDILGEGTEIATLTISTPSAGIVLGRRPSQTITIFDNDGNNHPTIVLDTSTTNFIDGGVLVSQPTPFKMSGVISDPTDPGKTLGVNLLVKDLEVASTTLTVTATSGNTAVVPNANLVLSGVDSIRTLKITPIAVGYANITVSVSDGIDVTTYVINYAASAASTTPSTTRWHTGISDASDAIAQNDNYYMSGDDELNVLNVYSRSASGLPLVSYNYTSNLNLPDLVKPEADIEAATVSPTNANKIYWLGSMSNGKAPFDNKPNRDRIFATTYTGTGASTIFTFAGYTALKTSLLAWGDANGYSFTASAAAGVDSKAPNGFAAEGVVFGPDNTTLYIGLRAPLVPTASRTKAVIAPILNFEAWFNGGAPSGNPTYGSPIELDLGGRGIRDMTRLSNGSYVIIAGSPSGAQTSAIFKWTGNATDAPIIVPSSVSGILNMEGVMQINVSSVLSTTSLQVITDEGDDVFYNDGTAAKDFGDLIYRKFRSDIVSSIDLTYPEINVKGGTQSIVDGNTAINTTDNTDYGNVIYSNATTRVYAIQNLGTATLAVSSINFTGTAAGDYSLVSAPGFPLNIAANSTYSITVQFAPAAIGFRNATINILSNDNDEATYNFNIRGNGLCNTPPAYTVTGDGVRCSGGAGLPVDLSSSTTNVNYQLYRGSTQVGSTVSGTGSLIHFGLQTTAGVYSVNATAVGSGCVANMTGSATITVNPSPLVHTFTGGGGYCTGVAGVPIGLTLTDTGISYQLYLSPTTTMGTAVNGTGGAISFGPIFGTTGVYYAIATDVHTHCATSMTGVTVSVNPLPAVFSVTGGGPYCATGAGMHVGLSGSATGVNYQLYKGSSAVGTPKPGTGSVIDFGSQTAAGTYTVLATDAHCMSDMTDSAVIIINPLPNPFTITGGGAFCVGDTGVHIKLSGSNTGIKYQLYRSSTLVGSPLAGTGASLDFGLQTTGGLYTTVATNTLTTCSSAMTSSVTVTANSLPTSVYNTTGGGSYCTPGAGLHIGVSNSDNGLRYQLSRSGILIGTYINGANAALDFGAVTVGGVYKVMEIDPLTGCMKKMNDSAVITPVAMVVPNVNISTGLSTDNTVCSGGSITFTALDINGGTVPTYTWTINSVPVGPSTASHTYTPVNGDVIRVSMHSNAQCAAPDTASGTMVVNVVTPGTPSVFIKVSPLTSITHSTPDTLTAITTNCGTSPSYQWYKNGTVISGATNMVYTSSTLANHDSLSCRVVTSGLCGGMVTYNSVIIRVFGVGVTQVTAGGDIRLFPNPNTGVFTVQGSLGKTDDQDVSLIIIDMLGKVIYKNNVTVHDGNINEQVTLNSSLANGMYILEARSGTENKVFHFVIRK